jgi:hypothetical protein
MEVGASEPLQLGVEVGEEASLHQRVVREIDARNDVRHAERHLLGLREAAVDVAIENHLPEHGQRDDLFWNQLGRVEDVKIEAVGRLLVERLHGELVLGIGTGLDGLVQVTAVEVGIRSPKLHRLVPCRDEAAYATDEQSRQLPLNFALPIMVVPTFRADDTMRKTDCQEMPSS